MAISAGFISVSIGDEAVTTTTSSLRVTLIFALVFNFAELFHRMRFFEFFEQFSLQLGEIILASTPLGLMLGFIILIWSLLLWVLDQNSKEANYPGLIGFLKALVDSYLLALGEFDWAGNFTEDDNNSNMFLFWMIFCIGSILSLLIILNMVIAVMEEAFGRVDADTDAFIRKAKLTAIIKNFPFLGIDTRKSLVEHKYVLAIEVDPAVDPIEKDSEEKHLNEDISSVQRKVVAMQAKLDRSALNLDKLCIQLGQTGIGLRDDVSED